MGAVTLYLILYNLISCAGWGYVWYVVYDVVMTGGEAQDVWDRAGKELAAVQTLALMEIVHSLLRFVKSPVFTVFMQVMSRIIVLWVFTWPATECHKHWSLIMMVGSWASVEVPRYLFYALNLIPATSGSKMPYPLFWLRYSLFMVLYPTGITGELLQISAALQTYYTYGSAFERILYLFPYWAYIPFGPFMIFNMWGNRKSQFKKRKAELSGAAAKRPLNGLVWPVTNEKTGDRSTSETNQAVWAAAVANVDVEGASAVRKARKWRFGYHKHVVNHVRTSLRSKKDALAIAKDGLDFMYDKFEFVRDGKTMPFSTAMKTIKGSFETGFIKGTGKRSTKECQVLYKGKALTGDVLKAQLDKWVKEGTMEPSAAESIKTVIANPGWVDLSDKYFVLLGATSAMGPLDLLLACGANIIGVDINRDFVWKKLITKVRNSPGTLTFPLTKPQSTINSDEELYKCSGCDLLGKTPEIANWVSSVCPGEQLTVGNYTYLDGALHVQLSLACDAIIERLCSTRKDTAIAFLCTPTDCHPVLQDAYECAQDNYKNRPFWQRIAEPIFKLKKNVSKPADVSGLTYSDGITVNQGPNYILAKRAQAWRTILARDAGHIVSCNVAPSTSTASVTSNKLFAAAYEGFVLFKALEVMRPETSSSAMLALLINDIRNPKSAAHPSVQLENPLQLMAHNAFHGGTFRAPYQIGSIGVVCVLYSFGTTYAPVWLGLAGLVGYSVAFVAGATAATATASI